VMAPKKINNIPKSIKKIPTKIRFSCIYLFLSVLINKKLCEPF
jgi:hypothetical protein